MSAKSQSDHSDEMINKMQAASLDVFLYLLEKVWVQEASEIE